MSQHRINRYTCTDPDCGAVMDTIDLHEGTTPFMLQCRTCNRSMATSCMYRTNQVVDASIAFIRPRNGPHATCEHVLQGGLIPVSNREALTEIEPQIQPNIAACLVTSFAMVLNVPVLELIEQIGHDGASLLFPMLDPPFCYRGHHLQELTFALFERGYALTSIEPIPVSRSKDQEKAHTDMGWWFEKLLLMRNGVLHGQLRGKRHSLAWDREKCFDPANGRIVPISHFEIQTFYMVTPIAKNIFK